MKGVTFIFLTGISCAAVIPAAALAVGTAEDSFLCLPEQPRQRGCGKLL